VAFTGMLAGALQFGSETVIVATGGKTQNGKRASSGPWVLLWVKLTSLLG